MIEVSMMEWNILTFIRHFRQQHGFSPTRIEIASGCGCGRGSVSRCLLRMKGRGLVDWKDTPLHSIMLCAVAIGCAP
jgi:hypothetical protein